MKTTILNFSAVAILVGSSFFAGRIQFSEKQVFQADQHELIENPSFSAESNVITKATYYEGEIIPVVDLPVLIIEADPQPKHYVQAHIVEGEIIPFVTLPTLDIEG